MNEAIPSSELQVATEEIKFPQEQQGSIQTPVSQSTELANDLFAKVGSTQVVETQTQPVTPEQEIVPDEQEILFHIENMMTNPNMYTPQYAERILRDAYAGRDFAQLQQENPQLAEAVAKLDNQSRESSQKYTQLITHLLEAPASPATDTNETVGQSESLNSDEEPVIIDQANIEHLQNIGDELTFSVTKPNGEKQTLSLKNMAFIAAIVAADLLLFKGHYTHMLLGEILSEKVNQKTKEIMGVLGFELPKDFVGKSKAYDILLNHIDTRSLVSIFKEFPTNGVETYNFLSGLSYEDRQRMLAGETFGKYGQHKFDAQQVQEILNKLTPTHREMLEITTASR